MATHAKSNGRPDPGLVVMDLFAGAGGLSLGFTRAGYEVAYALDFDEDACESYELNHPGVEIACESIFDVDLADLGRRFKGNVDAIIGGPSCVTFSTHGRGREDGWVPPYDRRNRLWEKMLRVVRVVQPRAFLLENVPGFLYYDNGNLAKEVFREYRKLGYKIQHKILLAANYGVPQLRRRLFIVGTRAGVNFEFPSETHLGTWRRDHFDKWEEERIERGLLPHVTCWDAIGDLPPIGKGLGWEKREYNGRIPADFARALKGHSKRIYDHEVHSMSEKYKALIKYVPPGGTWRDIPPYLLPDNYRGMRRTDSTNLLGRLDPEHPAYTITTQFGNVTAGCFTHPKEHRALSVREGARLQTFRDTDRFRGSLTSRCALVGNAVPPLLAEKLADSLANALSPGRSLPKHVLPAKVATPTAPSEKTRVRMKRQRRYDTSAEVLVQAAVSAVGLQFETNAKPVETLRRTADLVFRAEKVAIFVDGCFWHGCPRHSRDTKSNTTWWAEKIAKNKKRDAQTSRALRRMGWSVLRIWEHEEPTKAAGRIVTLVERQQVSARSVTA